MINEKYVDDLSRTFKIFGDSTRIKIMYNIFDTELCVQDIALNINMTQSAVSHQLSILKDARLVKGIKKGKEVYYSLDDEHVKKLLAVCEEHIKERGDRNA